VKWLPILVMSFGLVSAAWAADSTALSPTKDCPVGLVCLTENEATKIEKKRADLEREVERLRGKKRRIFAPYYAVGASYLPTEAVQYGGYADVGLRLGPFSGAIGLHDYGYGVDSHATISFVWEF
jgi:hypothetical protein